MGSLEPMVWSTGLGEHCKSTRRGVRWVFIILTSRIYGFKHLTCRENIPRPTHSYATAWFRRHVQAQSPPDHLGNTRPETHHDLPDSAPGPQRGMDLASFQIANCGERRRVMRVGARWSSKGMVPVSPA